MRIILDLQACQASSMHRGIGRYSMALALAMVRNGPGHDLRIVTNAAYPDSVATIRAAFDGLLPQSHITTFATPLPASEVDPRNSWRVHAAERVREQYLASLRPDIVHVASLFEGLGDNSVISVQHGDGRFDTAVTLYDLIPLMRKERYLREPSMVSWYYRKLESLKKAELLLAISASAREEGMSLLQLPADRVVNISSAADPIFHQRELAPETRADLLARHGLRRQFIMYTGGVDYRKNIEGLIEAFAALPLALRRQYQLAVVCSIRDPDRRRLERLAARCGLSNDDVVLTGFVSDDDLVLLYNCTALFVFPSLHEGFGLPVLEAMACGAPVIGSNTSSIPEVIGRADAMFDPTSIDAMRQSMAQVLLDPARQQVLRQHGLAQARHFSWDASARRAIEAFETLHGRRNDAGRTVVAAAPGPVARKPRLAWVAPPGSGTSYGSGLLPALAQYYEIELVLAQDGLDHPGLQGFTQRASTWFDDHAHVFDRVVYEFGNTGSHAYMVDLLERHPGIVVLHDFYLGAAIDAVQARSQLPSHYCRSLYVAHGYGALAEEAHDGRAASLETHPCNKGLLDRATGVIVHSPDALALANRWYGPDYAAHWRVVPPAWQAPGADQPALPADSASLYLEAIEAFARDGAGVAEQALIASLAATGASVPASDWLQTAAAIAANRPRRGPRQVLVHIDAGTGATQPDMLEAMLEAMLRRAPAGWRIEPVQHDGVRYRYARRYTLDLLKLADLQIDDAVVQASAGDVLLVLGGAADAVPHMPADWLACGVKAGWLATGAGAGDLHERLVALLARFE